MAGKSRKQKGPHARTRQANSRELLAAINRRRIAGDMRAGEKSRGVFASLRGPDEEVELPDWVYADVAAAEAEATPGRLPLALFRGKGKSEGDALVVMRLSEMVRHFDISVTQLDGPADGEES